MRRRSFILTIIIVAIVTIGLVFLLSNRHEDGLTPNPADSIGESEKIIGDPEKADVIVYEYADYACSHCAEQNDILNELLAKYGDRLVVVFRSYNLGFKNGPIAAKAATAADFQGYWKEYKDLLFKNQAEWYYASASDIESIFVDYFKTASGGKGDVEKFKSDINSQAVLAQLAYEQSMGEQIELTATPTFRIGGKKVAIKELTSTIEELMNKK